MIFSPLTAKEIQLIIKLQLSKLALRLKQEGLEIKVTDEAIDALSKLGFEPEYGARPVKRVIQKNILNSLSKSLLAGDINKGSNIIIDYFDNQIVFRNKKKTTK